MVQYRLVKLVINGESATYQYGSQVASLSLQNASLVWEPVASFIRDNQSIAAKRFTITLNNSSRID